MYFVTMLTHLPKENLIDLPRTFHKRTVGYFEDLDLADEYLKMNMADVNETIYPYAVVESVEQGFYPKPIPVKWYKFNDESKYEEIESLDFAYTFFAF